MFIKLTFSLAPSWYVINSQSVDKITFSHWISCFTQKCISLQKWNGLRTNSCFPQQPHKLLKAAWILILAVSKIFLSQEIYLLRRDRSQKLQTASWPAIPQHLPCDPNNWVLLILTHSPSISDTRNTDKEGRSIVIWVYCTRTPLR